MLSSLLAASAIFTSQKAVLDLDIFSDGGRGRYVYSLFEQPRIINSGTGFVWNAAQRNGLSESSCPIGEKVKVKAKFTRDSKQLPPTEIELHCKVNGKWVSYGSKFSLGSDTDFEVPGPVQLGSEICEFKARYRSIDESNRPIGTWSDFHFRRFRIFPTFGKPRTELGVLWREVADWVDAHARGTKTVSQLCRAITLWLESSEHFSYRPDEMSMTTGFELTKSQFFPSSFFGAIAVLSDPKSGFSGRIPIDCNGIAFASAFFLRQMGVDARLVAFGFGQPSEAQAFTTSVVKARVDGQQKSFKFLLHTVVEIGDVVWDPTLTSNELDFSNIQFDKYIEMIVPTSNRPQKPLVKTYLELNIFGGKQQ